MDKQVEQESSSQLAIIKGTGEFQYLGKVKSKADRLAEDYEKRSKVLEALNAKGLVDYVHPSNERFMKFYTTREIPFKNWIYMGYMLKIMGYLSPSNNAITFPPKANGHSELMNQQNIQDLLGVTAPTIRAFLKEAISEGVIAKITMEVRKSSHVAFLVNPAYCHYGNHLRWEVLNAFKDDPVFQSTIKEYHMNQLNYIENLKREAIIEELKLSD